MDNIVDRVMNSYRIELVQDIQRHNEVKAKLRKYLATLSSAGQRDADQLIEYGVAYLRGLHEGPGLSLHGLLKTSSSSAVS